jgi:hypothetical protein
MRALLATAAILSAVSIATAATAQPPSEEPASAPVAAASAQPKVGDWVRSSDGGSIGRINYVQKGKDGAPESVAIIYDMRMVHIPADTLSAGPKGYVTSLSRAAVDKLH